MPGTKPTGISHSSGPARMHTVNHPLTLFYTSNKISSIYPLAYFFKWTSPNMRYPLLQFPYYAAPDSNGSPSRTAWRCILRTGTSACRKTSPSTSVIYSTSERKSHRSDSWSGALISIAFCVPPPPHSPVHNLHQRQTGLAKEGIGRGGTGPDLHICSMGQFFVTHLWPNPAASSS